MDLSNPPDQSKVSLLTIPRAELDSNGGTSKRQASLMLLQLPPNWSAADLKDAHFVARPSQQAALVAESKRCSFTVHRVETSNALVMVPPHSCHDTRATKKSKVTENGKTLTILPARLLKIGGSGASFLELRKKSLSRIDLLAALKGCLLDPYNNKPTTAVSGRTVADLAASLQSSMYEIEQGLLKIQAFALPRTDPTEYCLLAEEALQECYAAIVAALAEADGCEDYAGVGGVQIDDFVTQVVDRTSVDETFPDSDFVIRHCLQQLRAKKQSISSTQLRLDVSKVRIHVIVFW
jgi:Sister chromatid cohesion protein Dcc1